jgi:hypothetical protein
MPSNTFLVEGQTSTVIFLTDRPFEGVNDYGPYRAYPVRTDRGVHTTFYPPKYLFSELDEIGVCRGMTVRLRASQAHTRDNRRYTRIEIEDTEKPNGVTENLPAQSQPSDNDTRNGILASVALKAATSTRGIVGEPQEIIETAIKYLAWLKSA